jgi:hyperosmotically inducible periplasmic protein
VAEHLKDAVRRFTMRAILLTLLIIIGVFVAYSYWGANGHWRSPFSEPSTPSVGTTGTVDTKKARERGAELGEKAAEAANRVGETVAEAAITTKIKAKMALDDSVKSRTIDVTTNGDTVTLSGTVRSQAERSRAVTIARETDGVKRVVDRLVVNPSA